MKTCWQVLGIEATTDTDAIRQAYLALLPSFHPETDPQGFKQLREAYENAL
ncbi:J domain-containing protein, partial [Salmonella enterica subsp. enterica serovar Cerro]|nr:J domain-containing protein [Salmonella enterica subsp. enterica serovar Cerro]